MLYALANPLSLLVLLASYVIGVTLHGWVQALVADRWGDRRPRMERRMSPDPRHQVDPFGAVAAAISGLGWARPIELLDRRRRDAVLAVGLSGPLANVALGVGLLLAWRFAYGPGGSAPAVDQSGAAYFLQHGAALSGAAGSGALLLAGCSQLYLGVLSLIPLPPLDGGRVLFALAPRTQGWQKAQYHLVEQNIGIAVLLALLLIPLGGSVPVLPQVLDSLLTPVLRLLCGG